jgi:Protein of unknwon function (DUF3310)
VYKRPEKDMINHPPHYSSLPATCSNCGHGIECIDIVRHMGFDLGNTVKYLWRWRDKGGVEDLKKARFYLDDTIRQLEKEKK